MAKKDWAYRGKTLEELQAIPNNEIIKMIPARSRKTFLKIRPDSIQGRTMEKILKAAEIVRQGKKPKAVRTHRRDIIILPKMIGANVAVYNGKKFDEITLDKNMIGHVIGEFIFTRKPVKHGKMGIGATGGSKAKSVK
ncbi:MAG: ribosomal protein S19 family protein [Candidatus Diapherotrites archaeon]|nr:ribosomal protein S19 family protein [Candidatus Diapherotrites archaeon]